MDTPKSGLYRFDHFLGLRLHDQSMVDRSSIHLEQLPMTGFHASSGSDISTLIIACNGIRMEGQFARRDNREDLGYFAVSLEIGNDGNQPVRLDLASVRLYPQGAIKVADRGEIQVDSMAARVPVGGATFPVPVSVSSGPVFVRHWQLQLPAGFENMGGSKVEACARDSLNEIVLLAGGTTTRINIFFSEKIGRTCYLEIPLQMTETSEPDRYYFKLRYHRKEHYTMFM
jgi:hypothetical protein